jgi:hypothetical protein
MATDKYNWFLCVEEKPLQWSCCETTAERVLNGRELNLGGKNTMAIPISKSLPKFLDRIVLQYEIKRELNIKVKR